MIVSVSPLTLAIENLSVLCSSKHFYMTCFWYFSEAAHTCLFLQWDDVDLFELLSIMCNQNAAQGKCGNTTNQL